MTTLLTPAAIPALAERPTGPQHPAGEGCPPGASRAFVSNDPVIRAALDDIAAGRFAAAEGALHRLIDGDLPARDELLDVIARTRREYSLNRSGLLEKLRAGPIPDLTDAELDRWIAAGDVQARTIDGELRIFRREPGHLLRFGKEAMARRDAHQPPAPATLAAAPAWTRDGHVRAVLTAAAKSGSAEVLPVRTTVTYTLTVQPNVPGARAGSVLRVWLPFPQEYGRQREAKLLSSDPPGAVVASPAIDGDPVTGPAQRTVFFERRIDDPAQAQQFRIVFSFLTSAYCPDLDDARAVAVPTDLSPGTTYLRERPPHIVFTPEVRARAAEIVGTETNPLIKARRVFEWVDANVRWTPEEEYSVIPNLAMHGLKRGKGDCGVAGMLFITLCRAAGVPARWQSGWTTHPVGWNMHDWAEIYVEPWGWLPVDASYGRLRSDDPSVRNFYFGHTDSHRLIVNLDYGRELSPNKPSFRSEPLDFQRGEVELDGKNLYFDRWDYEIEFERQPGP